MSDREQLDLRCINTIRFLAVDAVQRAMSGHPGSPMGDAVLQYVLWDRYLRHNPENPVWPGRDRYILSAGHASMLHYALLYLTGYDLSLDEIRNFRQWNSKTPGHPERAWSTPGIEVTTGPLGQGFAHGVGMAVAERWMAERFNRPGHEVIDNYTYALVSDGDLQEGISYEASSLAGFLGLGKLIYLYMDNGIQIEGETRLTFNEDVAARFRAQQWHVVGPIDGLNIDEVDVSIREARGVTDKPSLIICRTTIGYGSPLEHDERAHGAPLGEENVRAAKQRLGWPLEPEFHAPEDVLSHMRAAVERGKAAEERWKKKMEAYREEHPALAAELKRLLSGELLPEGWDAGLAALAEHMPNNKATRVYNGLVLNELAKTLLLLGGSADLGTSVKTVITGSSSVNGAEFSGRNFHFGVREHAMAAVTNGVTLYGGPKPYCSTFLIFVDYMRPALRLAALMKLPSLFVFSHDSIGVGEDGPTHQPIEQLMHLRGMPNVTLFRPADAAETIEAWRAAIKHTGGPAVLVFTRQSVPDIDRNACAGAEGLRRGAYVLWQSGEEVPDIILIGTGSELHLALEAGRTLADENGCNVRVVSMPCWEYFDAQDKAYRENVLPAAVRRRVSVEAGLKQGWEKYIGIDGASVGMDRYGRSAPGKVLFEKFDITAEAVLREARRLLDDD